MQLDDVRRNYDRLAPWYDLSSSLVFDALLRTHKHRVRTIDLLGDLAGATVLDIGCGTGVNFPLLVPRVGRSGRIIALDYSEGMLAQARKRMLAHGWTNIELMQGDAAVLEGVPEPVDAVVSVWCLGIVHDLDAAIDRAIDVLRPGGRLSIMDFGRARPDRGPLHWLYPVYRLILDRAGISGTEDLDDDALRARWERARNTLRGRLRDLQEETYLSGGGIIIAGTKRGDT